MSHPKTISPETVAPPDLDEVDVVTLLHALADPIRLQMVRQLAGCGEGGEVSCGRIEVPVTKSTATHHLKVLLRAGVTAEREEGTRKFVRLRRGELEQRFPGLLRSVLAAPERN
jgi:DNA-binding transcriptional ArsR family regulator